MRTNIIIHYPILQSGCKMITVIALFFSFQVSAQQKFTLQLNNGMYRQLQVEGLKLTFDNNGAFSCWQNGIKQDITFASVGKIYFTEMSLSTKINENISSVKGIKIYPNPTTGIVKLQFNQNIEKEIEVSVSNPIGAEVYRKELLYADVSQIDLSNQLSGIYFLKVLVDNQLYINKVIIQK